MRCSRDRNAACPESAEHRKVPVMPGTWKPHTACGLLLLRWAWAATITAIGALFGDLAPLIAFIQLRAQRQERLRGTDRHLGTALMFAV